MSQVHLHYKYYLWGIIYTQHNVVNVIQSLRRVLFSQLLVLSQQVFKTLMPLNLRPEVGCDHNLSCKICVILPLLLSNQPSLNIEMMKNRGSHSIRSDGSPLAWFYVVDLMGQRVFLCIHSCIPTSCFNTSIALNTGSGSISIRLILG